MLIAIDGFVGHPLVGRWIRHVPLTREAARPRTPAAQLRGRAPYGYARCRRAVGPRASPRGRYPAVRPSWRARAAPGPRMSVTPSRAWLARSASGPQAGGGILDAGWRRKRLGRPFTRRVSTAVRAPLCSASNRSPRASRSRRCPRGWSRGVCATGDLQPARCR